MKPENILITGGCGFLGQHLLRHLIESFGDDIHIRVLDLNKPATDIFDFPKYHNVEVVLGSDICDNEGISNHFAGIGLVIHLAGVVSFALKDKQLLHRVNVDGTRNVLRAAAGHNVDDFIHVSSVAAMGYNDDRDSPVNEDFRFDWRIAERKRKYYMLTKHLADVEVEKYIEDDHNCVILYPGLMFGPGDVTNSARLINAVRASRIPFNMPGGTNIVDVRDVARGIVTTIERDVTCGKFLLAGENLTFTDINRTIAEKLDVKPPSRRLPRPLCPLLFRLLLAWESISSKRLQLTADNLDSAAMFRYFDSSRAKQQLGWLGQIPFAQTIQDTIEWMIEDGQLA